MRLVLLSRWRVEGSILALDAAFVMCASLPAIRQMTSVLYSSGLNYQGRNPMGSEMRGMEKRITEIESRFGGIKGQMEQFLAGASGGANEAVRKVAEAKASLEAQHAAIDGKITDLRTHFEHMQSMLDVLKARVDRMDGAVAAASTAATQAKAMATAAAADAASAKASAATADVSA